MNRFRPQVSNAATLLMLVAAHTVSTSPAAAFAHRAEKQPVQRGTVTGTVRFVGEVPPPVIVIQGADEQQVLYVNESGGQRSDPGNVLTRLLSGR